MNKFELNVLAVNHIDEDAMNDSRVTISPSAVKMIASKDTIRRGRELKLACLHFIDGDQVELCISQLDLLRVEEIIGGYSLGEC